MLRQISLLAAAALLGISPALAEGPSVPAVDVKTLTAPDISAAPATPDGDMIRYGHRLITETFAVIGPEVSDPVMRYAGNNLSCQSCHVNAASQPYAMPFAGIWGQFPQYRGREGRVSTMEDRINGCMERSMNGKALPLASREMIAIMAYIKFMSQAVPVGARLTGAGTLAIREPDRAADPKRGADIFAANCVVCHQADGQGQRNGEKGDAKGYLYPPLWGPDSFNNGAGTGRLLTAAAFIKANMPLGTTWENSVLSDEDAYDVAAYVISHDRPAKPGLDKDYPTLTQKPVDAPYGPYADTLPPEQHKFGPFGPIRAAIKALTAKPAQ